MKRKLSLRGKMFLSDVRPLVTFGGWVSFISAIVWVCTHSFSFISGVLFIFGVQVGYAVLYVIIMAIVLTQLEKKWEKERIKYQKQMGEGTL